MNNKVLYEKDGYIGRITLNNSEESNPITKEVLMDLTDAFKLSHENQDMCVIYSAKGENFTFGADLKYGYELISNKDKQSDAAEYLWSWQELTIAMMDHPGIIIVGYHGWIVGGGFEHTLACDLRIAANNTKIMMPELGLGLFYSNASTRFLSQIVGLSIAKELMLMGEEIDANEAFRIGLVNRICKEEELDNVLNEYANKLVSKDKYSLFMAKKQINGAQESTIDEVLYREGRAMIMTGRSGHAEKRIKAFLNKK
jgi:enoyl-CoA hydratase